MYAVYRPAQYNAHYRNRLIRCLLQYNNLYLTMRSINFSSFNSLKVALYCRLFFLNKQPNVWFRCKGKL